MKKEEVIRALTEIRIFKELNKKELEEIVERADVKTYPPRAVIFKKEGRATSFFIVLEGEIKIFRDRKNGQRQLIAILERGEIIGERVLFSNFLHTNTAITSSEGPTVLLEVAKEDFYKLNKIQVNTKTLGAKLSNIIIESLIDRLFHADNKIVTLKEIGQAVGEETSLRMIARKVLCSILEVIPSKKALLAIFNPYTKRIEVQAYFGYDDKISKVSFSAKEGLFGEAAKQKKAITDKDLMGVEFKKQGFETKRFILVPIIMGGKFLGVIFLGDKSKGREFSSNNKVLIRIIADILGPAIEWAVMRRTGKSEEALKRKYVEF